METKYERHAAPFPLTNPFVKGVLIVGEAEVVEVNFVSINCHLNAFYMQQLGSINCYNDDDLF